jgi:hypothetical protein
MESHDQLDQWVMGNSIHNKERDECCPDFSCCGEEIAPKDVRERFAKAYYDGDEETQHQMLMMFLGGMIKKSCTNAYIAGGDIEGEVQ